MEATEEKVVLKGLQEMKRIARVRAAKKRVAASNAERKLKLADVVLKYLETLKDNPEYGPDNVNALIREFEVKKQLIKLRIDKIRESERAWEAKAEEIERKIEELKGENHG
jgi:ERCC4-type nuclease